MSNQTPKWLRRWVKYNPHEWHHLYTGIIMLIIGIYCTCPYLNQFLTHIGVWLIIDDIGQHRLQYTLRSDYHSYGHYIGKPLYQLRRYLIRKYPNLTWLDKI